MPESGAMKWVWAVLLPFALTVVIYWAQSPLLQRTKSAWQVPLFVILAGYQLSMAGWAGWRVSRQAGGFISAALAGVLTQAAFLFDICSSAWRLASIPPDELPDFPMLPPDFVWAFAVLVSGSAAGCALVGRALARLVERRYAT